MRNFIKLKKAKTWLVALLCFLSICSCSSLGLVGESIRYNTRSFHGQTDQNELVFPEGFLWGAATAAHQVEGDDMNNDWGEFELQGHVKDGVTSGIAANHYNMYEQDFDLMKAMNLNSYRFSIEWNRIEPEEGRFDQNEIEHYRDVLKSLRERGITPMVTLHHFTNPIWVADKGGWENPQTINDYVEYVEYTVSQLKDEVELWITINEPLAYIGCGYVQKKWPPYKQELQAVPAVFLNMTRAHNLAYDSIHTIDNSSQVGIAEHTAYIEPENQNNILENIGAYLIDFGWNRLFVNGVRSKLDFIGLHYYYKNEVSLSLIPIALSGDPKSLEHNEWTQKYNPEGLYYVLKDFKEYNIPIYITENGTYDGNDVPREQFIREHLIQIWYAIQDGVDVRGYYYWALLDSFEWAEGFSLNFGLVKVDRVTLERSIKPDALDYAMIAGNNKIKLKDS